MYFIKKRSIDISIYSLQTSPSPSSSSCTRPSCASAHVPLPVPTKTDSQVQFESHHYLKSCVDERSSLLFFGTWFHQLGHLRVICLCQCQQRLTLRCNLRVVIIIIGAVVIKGVSVGWAFHPSWRCWWFVRRKIDWWQIDVHCPAGRLLSLLHLVHLPVAVVGLEQLPLTWLLRRPRDDDLALNVLDVNILSRRNFLSPSVRRPHYYWRPFIITHVCWYWRVFTMKMGEKCTFAALPVQDQLNLK